MSTPQRSDRAGRALRLTMVLLLVAAFVTTARSAEAQGNYRSAPMGGRTTLLGGTGVVYGLDGAAVFMNPATALRIDPGRLSFSVNFYSASFMSAPNWYKPGPVDTSRFGPLDVEGTSASDTRLSSLPSSLCFFFRVGRIPWFKGAAEKDPRVRDARLGLCFATTQTESFYYDDEAFEQTGSTGIVTRQSQAIAQTFRRFQFGPTYSMWVVPGLNVGMSVHGSIASHWSSLTALARSEQGSIGMPVSSMFHSSSHGVSWQLHAIAGATYSFGRQSVGMAIEAPSVHLLGSGGATQFAQSDADGNNRSSSLTGDGSFDVQTPARVSLGTGFSRSWGTAELNVSYFASMGRAYSATVDGNRTVTGGGSVSSPESLELAQRARGVVNVGVGAEVFMTPQLSLLGGLSTDLSAVPKGDLKSNLFNYYPARTNRLAASFGIGSHRNDGTFIVGTELSYGWGERLTTNSYQALPALETTTHQTIGLLFVIAGSTSFRAISRAVEDVTRAVTGPSKDPAKNNAPSSSPALEPPPKKPSPNR